MSHSTQTNVHQRTRESGRARLHLPATATRVNDVTRHKMIEEAAYFLAQRRAFADGHALDDWLEAEMQINAMLTTVAARH